MSDSRLVFRVVDWDQRYETNRTLKKCGARTEVPVSANLGRVGFQKLLKLPGSAEVLGLWYFLQMLAANCERRGVLAENGRSLTAQDLAQTSGWDVPSIERGLEILSSPEIGLLEQVPLEVGLRPPVIVPAAPRKCKPKPPHLERCPFCHADLTGCREGEAPAELHRHTAPGNACGSTAPSTRKCDSREDGLDCPSNGAISADAGSVGHVVDAASIRSQTDADSGRVTGLMPPARPKEATNPGVADRHASPFRVSLAGKLKESKRR